MSIDQWEQREAEKLAAPLIGKVIVGIDVSQDEEALRFRLKDGSEVVWRTSGDCCSESWWADMLELDAILGRYGMEADPVTEIEALDLPDPIDGRSRQSEDQVYGYKLKTSRHYGATLIFRNSSNGYYGGSAYVSEARGYDQWREITENTWSA